MPAPTNPFDALVDFFDAARATPTHARLVAACFAPVAAAPPGPHLDVGCGAGELVARSLAAGRRSVGTDLSAPMCRRAARLFPAARFVVAASELLPFADGSFAAVTAMLVLHLSDGPRALTEAARVLRPGGALSLVTQSTAWSEAAARDFVARRSLVGTEREFCIGSGRSGEANRRYAPEELRAALADAGFADVRLGADLDGGLLVAAAVRR